MTDPQAFLALLEERGIPPVGNQSTADGIAMGNVQTAVMMGDKPGPATLIENSFTAQLPEAVVAPKQDLNILPPAPSSNNTPGL